MTVDAAGFVADTEGWGDQLYASEARTEPRAAVTLRAVPYYAWANRGPGAMRVWVPASTV